MCPKRSDLEPNLLFVERIRSTKRMSPHKRPREELHNTNQRRLTSLVKEFTDILPLAVSRIESYISDEALRDLLLSGNCAGFTNHIRLEHLSVLVKRYGPFDILDFILAELKNSGVEHVVQGHIERLNELNAHE
jgi:hypothetical protein